MEAQIKLGNMRNLCGLFLSIGELYSILQQEPLIDDTLDDYPLAEIWNQIFDDSRLPEMVSTTAADCGLDANAILSLANLERALLIVDGANKFDATSAKNVSQAIQEALVSAEAWRRSNCGAIG